MKWAGLLRSKLGLLAALAACANVAQAVPERWQLNMTPGVTRVSHDIYQIHMWGLYVCCAIGIVVFGAMIIAMIRFRKSKGAVAATWSHNTKVEIVWTVVPILILVSLAYPATRVVSDMARQLRSGLDPWKVEDNGEPAYLLNVDHPLVVPTDTKIRFVVTGDDVIHAWWVPALGIKQDAIPGIINDAWTVIHDPGIYRGQCAELCGQDHGFMPIVVKAVPMTEFQKWLDEQEAAATRANAPAAPAPAAAGAG